MLVEVFKTNVQNAYEARSILRKLKNKFPESKVNFDLDDCDKILRVQAVNIHSNLVISLLAENGFNCLILT